jgi:spermidine synthase
VGEPPAPREADAPTATSSASFSLVITLFALSGASGLIVQLCFSKYLSYVVGATAHAVSAVLAAFMTGLALGAYLGGGYSRRVRRPLVAYGVLELVVAAAVALSPLAFRALTPLYAELARIAPGSLTFLSALRWLSALLIVIVPTTAMGATLPLLSRLLPAGSGYERSREQRLGALYAVNTAGGALGALGAAYALLPWIGMDATLFAAALGSASVGAVAIYCGRSSAIAVVEQSDVLRPSGARVSGYRPASADASGTMYLVAFASGALVFAAEVVFTHLLAVVIGNSAYAFGLILAAFLACLCLGASRAAAMRGRFGDSALPLGLILTGLALVSTIPLWDELPLLFEHAGKTFRSFGAREATRGLIAFAILSVPTTLMGLTFPLLLQRVAASTTVGLWVGRLTTINTIGAVVGSLGVGYLLLPALGSERTLFAVALAFVAVGVLTTRFVVGRARYVGYLLALLTASLWAVVPRWDLAKLTAGTNVYFDEWRQPERVLFVRDDVHGGVTTVTEERGVRTLYTNGKFQGNTGWEMSAQHLVAHYPSLFVSRYERVLVVGLGTATTLGAVATYPWPTIDVVEISPAIVEAAERYFGEVNRSSLHDPRVKLHIVDGRNFLLVEPRQYDLITMELSSIWLIGSASLYSREFYEIAKQRLAPGGVFQQWVQLHHIRRKDFATIVNTLRHAFPHVALFYGGGQGILIASMAPLRASAERAAKLELRAGILATLPPERRLLELLDDALLVGPDLDRFLHDSAREAGQPLAEMISTDGNLYLEYATPHGNLLPWSAREELVAKLREYRSELAVAQLKTD